MEGAFKPGRLRRGQENIKISVNLDRTLTSSSCCKIAEDILKYLLYQRHQIPVQYDILLRKASAIEAENNSGNGSNEMDCSNPTEGPNNSHLSYTEDTLKLYQSKEEKLHLKRRRNQLRWLEKVKKLIHQYNALTQKIRSEIEEGNVVAVSFILGSSVITGKELFSINFPHDYVIGETDATCDRHITLQFFRAFVTNEDLVKLVSRPCSLQKLWVMLQKQDQSESTPSATNSKPPLCDLIPRSGFSPSQRTKIVEIAITHKSPLGSPMELTPSIGKLINQVNMKSSRKNSSKRSLVFGMNNVSKRYSYSSDDTAHGNSQDLGMTQCSFESVPKSRSASLSDDSNDSPVVHDSMSFCNGPGLMTPRDVLKVPEPIVETPIISSQNIITQPMFTASPSRMLASCLSNFNISDAVTEQSENATWYQVDHVIKGFKDICFR